MDFVPDMLVLFMGTIDEEHLIGKKVDGSEEETELGIKFKREGGLQGPVQHEDGTPLLEQCRGWCH